MAETEQAKPLAPSAFQSRSDEEEASPSSSIPTHLNFRQRKYIKCFGCCTAFLLIIAVTVLVLFFTVFHVKNPAININNITPLRLELDNGSLRNDTNVTLVVDVSVKNPNIASFKFNNGTTTVLYGGNNVGEAIIPSGIAKARRTIHINVTVDLIPERILQVPSLLQDVGSGQLSMNSNTVISGKVKILKIVKKYYVVEVNCSMTYNFSSKDIQQHCKSRFR